jgi:hypothetical protein
LITAYHGFVDVLELQQLSRGKKEFRDLMCRGGVKIPELKEQSVCRRVSNVKLWVRIYFIFRDFVEVKLGDWSKRINTSRQTKVPLFKVAFTTAMALSEILEREICLLAS